MAGAKPLTDKQRAFADRFVPLAEKIASNHSRERRGINIDADDVLSAAGLGLVLAAQRFDPSKGDEKLPERYVSFRIGRTLTDCVHRKGAFGDSRKFRGETLPAIGRFSDDYEAAAPQEDEPLSTVTCEFWDEAEVAEAVGAPVDIVVSLLRRRHQDIPGVIIRRTRTVGVVEFMVLPVAVDRIRVIMQAEAEPESDEQGGFPAPEKPQPEPRMRRAERAELLMTIRKLRKELWKEKRKPPRVVVVQEPRVVNPPKTPEEAARRAIKAKRMRERRQKAAEAAAEPDGFVEG